jgi:hypothetical protein
LEGVQFILSVFTFIWIMFGYAWLIESWYYDSNAIPLRYKILFLGILIMFTLLYLPVIIVCIMVVVKLVNWMKNERKKIAMKRKLEQIHMKMYNSKFNFHKILPELTIEFFQIPLKEGELDLLRTEFSEPVYEKSEEVCPVCFVNFDGGDNMTKVPICKHAYHMDCLTPWLKDHTTCPTCRAIVRVQMIEHYHGSFEVPAEDTANNQQQDNETDASNPNMVIIGNTGIEIPIIGDGLGRDHNTAPMREVANPRATNLREGAANQGPQVYPPA